MNRRRGGVPKRVAISARQTHHRDVFGGGQFVELLTGLAGQKAFYGFVRAGLEHVFVGMAEGHACGFAQAGGKVRL